MKLQMVQLESAVGVVAKATRQYLKEAAALGYIGSGIASLDEIPAEICFNASRNFITSRGLDPRYHYTDPDYLILGKATRAAGNFAYWCRGQIMADLRIRAGGTITGEAMRALGLFFGVSESRLHCNMLTAETWAYEERLPVDEVPYSHHEALNPAPDEERLAMLMTVAERGLSVEQARALVAFPGQRDEFVPWAPAPEVVDALMGAGVISTASSPSELVMKLPDQSVIIKAVIGSGGRPRLHMEVSK